MANKEHLEMLRQGIDAWNRWRLEIEADPNLSHANLSRLDLSGADLSGVHLSSAILGCGGINLSHANLSGANLSGADLSGAKLCGASLSRANLSHTNLSGSDLSEAILIGTNFHSTDLKRANFENALASFTEFADCDLSEVEGLDLTNHEGPSTIGIDTLYKSKGRIPDSFLRGCGVPASFITQILSLVGAVDGIQFYSCFISYSTKDEKFAQRLHGMMRDARLRVWFAPEDIQGGKKLHEQIETAIRVYDKLLIVLSEASLQSEWVMDELRKGFKAERNTGKRKLFPVRLTDYETLKRWECRDSISGKDLAEEVRQYFIPDFSNWKDHDQFEAAFSRLVKDLRA